MKNLAQIGNPLVPGGVSNAGASYLGGKFVPALLGTSFVIGTVIFVAYLILGAIQWIMSGGDKARLEGAKGQITNALLGIVVLFSTFALIKLIETFFTIDILSIDIGPLRIR